MSLLTSIKNLYSLETLDMRFVTSSTSPPEAAASAKVDPVKPSPEDAAKLARRDGKEKVISQAQPALWNTPEFYFYALVFIVAIPSMLKTVYDVSQREWSSTLRVLIAESVHS